MNKSIEAPLRTGSPSRSMHTALQVEARCHSRLLSSWSCSSTRRKTLFNVRQPLPPGWHWVTANLRLRMSSMGVGMPVFSLTNRSGERLEHFEVVPRSPMLPARYQLLLRQIRVSPYGG